MRLVLGLSIALLMVSSPVSGESEDHMRVGLETLLERESLKYQTCIADKDAECDFDEVHSYLKLLDLWDPVATKKTKYPRIAMEAGFQGLAEFEIAIADDGLVTRVEPLYCESGTSDARLRFQWKVDGRFCRQFTREASKAFDEYLFPVFPDSLANTPRVIRYRHIFSLKSDFSPSLDLQITDLSRAQLNQISELTKNGKWQELEKFAADSEAESPAFIFYAGDAAWNLGDRQMAVERYRKFLENGGGRYWHFGAKAATLSITYLYDQADDHGVVSIGHRQLLEQYLREGTVVQKNALADAILKYASSLTLIEEPRIGRAILTLRNLGNYSESHSGVTEQIQQMIKRELANYESQIINIGRAKAKQLSDPVKLD